VEKEWKEGKLKEENKKESTKKKTESKKCKDKPKAKEDRYGVRCETTKVSL